MFVSCSLCVHFIYSQLANLPAVHQTSSDSAFKKKDNASFALVYLVLYCFIVIRFGCISPLSGDTETFLFPERRDIGSVQEVERGADGGNSTTPEQEYQRAGPQ